VTVLTPWSAKISPDMRVNLASRSRMRKSDTRRSGQRGR
jgi:hypothetical protein